MHQLIYPANREWTISPIGVYCYQTILFYFFFISAKYTQALVHIVTRLFWYLIYVQGSTGEALENGMTPEWSKQKVFLCFLL